MDHVCRKLGLRAGMQVFEAGCGWGALAIHMARHWGVTVRAFNISEEQIKYARAQRVTWASKTVSSLYKTIGVASLAGVTPSSPSECWNMWASRTTVIWARSFIVA